MKKRFVVIGLGNFGWNVAVSLASEGHDVIGIDKSEDLVDRIASHVSRAVVADGTHKEALDQAGAKEADCGIISTGENLAASILCTMALQDLKVEEIYVKVTSAEHDRVMKRMGVEETIYPERESGQNLARRLTGRGLLNYVYLAEGYSIQEMVVPADWIGKTLREIGVRRKFKLQVIGIHDQLRGTMQVPPEPDAILKMSDTLLVAGPEAELLHLSD